MRHPYPLLTRLLVVSLIPCLCLSMALNSVGALSNEESGLTKLAEGVYARIVSSDSNAVSNSGVVVLQNFVLVYDTHFTPEAGQTLLGEISSVTSKPVHYIVNSHFHPDHTHGNQAFPTAQQILSTTNARRDVLQRDLPALTRARGVAQAQLDKMRKDLVQEKDPGQQNSLRDQIRQRQEFVDRMSKLKILSPVITLEDRLSLVDGRTEVQLLYLGMGHTDGDLVLFLPNQRIAFVGDLFFNLALPNTQDSFLLSWIKTLGEVLNLEADTFVPGHGPVGSREQVKEFLSYLENLKALIEPRVSRGDSLEQVLRDLQIPAKYASYSFQSFFPANVQKMYTELKSLNPPSAPAPNPEALRKAPPGFF